VSPDGTRLASACMDGEVRIWDPATGDCLASVRDHGWGVKAVAFSPDGKSFASCGWDRTIRVRNAQDGREISRLRGHTSMVRSLAYAPGGARLLSFAWDGQAKVWALGRADEVRTLRGHGSSVIRVAFSSDGRRLASLAARDGMRIWDVSRGTAVAVVPEASRVAAAGGRLWHWRQDGSVHAQSFGGEPELVRSGVPRPHALAADARDRLFLACDDGILVLGGAALPVRGARHLAVSPDGSMLACSPPGRAVETWDIDAARRTGTLAGPPGGTLAFDPAGGRLVVAGADHRLRVYDAGSGELLATMTGHTERARSVAFAPDGSRIASASPDGTVRLWDARSGAQVLVLHDHPEMAMSVAWSPDGSCLASGGGNSRADVCTVRLWETE